MKPRNLAPFYSPRITVLLAAFGLAQAAVSADLSPARIGPTTTLSFEEKTTALTPASQEKLEALIKNAKTTGKIKEIQLAVWSDNPAPRKDEQLSKPDRTLAEGRIKSVEKYLKTHNKIGVTPYNMAERSSWLAKIFDSAEADLKTEIGRGSPRGLP